MDYAFVSGLLTSASLILAVGAQNAFILRQGLTGDHVFWLCLFCSVSDAILISIGVFGFGLLTLLSPNLTQFLSLTGAAFLFAYGIHRFHAAAIGESAVGLGGEIRSLRGILALAAVFTWANPHVYLDTVALIGAVSTGFEGTSKLAFAMGATTASFLFFFSLGYGARFLAPLLSSPLSWRLMDACIGVTMWVLAILLVVNA